MVRRSILVSGDDDFNELPPPKRTLDLNMTGESKDQVYVRTFNAKEQLSAQLISLLIISDITRIF